MFVHPEQIDRVLKSYDQVGKGRLVVSRIDEKDEMILYCESAIGGSEVADSIAQSLREVCKLRGSVEFVRPGTLANDGNVIDDTRPIE